MPVKLEVELCRNLETLFATLPMLFATVCVKLVTFHTPSCQEIWRTRSET